MSAEGEISNDLPYSSEYAKSGRASCKQCKTSIEKGSLRMAKMVQSPMFDGKVPHWHHLKCFFTRSRPQTVAEIGNFDVLRWEDQEKIRELVKNTLEGKGPGGKGKGMTKNGTIKKDFRLEYAKSGAAKCQACEEKIKKGLVRVSKKEYNSERALRYGPYDAWHHLKCFAEKQEELEFFDSGDSIDGFKTLSKEDQEEVKNEIKKCESTKRKLPKDETEPANKKIKVDSESEKERSELKNQLKKVYYYRDNLAKLKKKDLDYILEFNGQDIMSGLEPTLDRISDGMTFGSLQCCPECEEGQLVFKGSLGYQCTGNLSEWTKCVYKTHDPKRKPFKIPEDFCEEYSWFKIYKGIVRKRVIPAAEPVKTQLIKKESSALKLPFKDFKFVLDGNVDKKALKTLIKELGGGISDKVSEKTAAVISDPDSVGAMSPTIKSAKSLKIQVIPPEALDKAMKMDPAALIETHSICEWGSNPSNRLPKSSISKSNKKKLSGAESNLTKSVRLTLKDGACVDPDSGLEDKCHVYKRDDVLYSAVLGAVSIQDAKNSYYKLQVLKHDKKSHKYYVFRSWGRVGTTIGGKKVENFDSSGDAVREFERLYEEKTGNRWKKRSEFEKLPGKFYPLDIDFGPSNGPTQKLEVSESKSNLALPIKELISLIFDIESMKKTLVEFEIDLNKMPLGKLSKRQIEKAYSILTEAETQLDLKDKSQSKLIDLTNRFFTLIPHDFGMHSPPLLDNLELIKNKVEMLENMLEIEVAYSLLQSESDNDGVDPFDSHYEKLNTELEVLDKSTEEYEILEKYVKNTHAATHSMYTLEIESILKVNRKGEGKRFKPFKKLPNRHLLWHGSRTTNFAGILSQGLRIAPPEAPVTGYMFGKGVYFADMVSKSANYCQTSKKKNTGLLLLCDVALGNIYERNKADFIEKLPAGKHSTKGVGKTQPDEKDFTKIDGSIVPCGVGVKKSDIKSDLLYSEYIVYDVAQINCKYLFRMKFNYKIYGRIKEEAIFQ